MTEFRDDFNPCNSNNTNKIVTLHALSIAPIDSSLDSNEFAHAIAIGHEHKDRLIRVTTYIESLNKLMDPTNKILFHSSAKKEFIHVVILLAGFIGDQLGKRNCTSHAAGNGDCGGTHGLSCNWKEMFHEVPS